MPDSSVPIMDLHPLKSDREGGGRGDGVHRGWKGRGRSVLVPPRGLSVDPWSWEGRATRLDGHVRGEVENEC